MEITPGIDTKIVSQLPLSNKHTPSTSMPLQDLPVGLLLNNLAPELDTKSLLRLARVNRFFYDVVTNNDSLWMAKIEDDYHFPLTSSGRLTGWFDLYRRISHQGCYLWGECSNGRQGFTRKGSRPVERNGVVLPTQLRLPTQIVDLTASGFSFHAITSAGKIVVWGTMDGESWAPDRGPVSNPHVTVAKPVVLAASEGGDMGHIVQIASGRKHIVCRNTAGEVFQYQAFGRVHSLNFDTVTERIVAVEAGWASSYALTELGSVYMWDPLDYSQVMRESASDTLSLTHTNPLTVSPTRLPDLPDTDDKIKLVAAGADFVLALTTQAKVYWLDIRTDRAGQDGLDLETLFVTHRRTWACLDDFCDPQKLKTYATDPSESHVFTITHISAHFNSFSVYSVPKNNRLFSEESSQPSLVLLGRYSEESKDMKPEIIPELQGINVIKVVHGDYHNLALTEDGKVYAWGSYSNGALGLGYPSVKNSYLYRDAKARYEAEKDSHSEEDELNVPGGFGPVTEEEDARMLARMFPPERVEHPTLVEFPDHRTGTDDYTFVHSSEKFVFVVTASGWHSGSIVIDLGAEAAEQTENESEQESSESDIPQGGTFPNGRPIPILQGGASLRFPGRIGFAGRGARRGVTGQGPGLRRPVFRPAREDE